ncbi:hypothetical protein CVT26_004564 [Gymnopilus dilepis]|uniref:SMODS and SLOG-associating 2TM effector domain-containing protein n=1 Tax=Gymnopilus dilepis TaxID=231916 RepID=A0A409YJA1_9AGAR|nr:hypothetical protein CVT26_004564 [Gymnopilus dilepis]
MDREDILIRVEGWSRQMQETTDADKGTIEAVNTLMVVAAFIAGVQAQVLAISINLPGSVLARITNILGFIGLVFEISGTSLGAIHAVFLQRRVRSGLRSVNEINEFKGDLDTILKAYSRNHDIIRKYMRRPPSNLHANNGINIGVNEQPNKVPNEDFRESNVDSDMQTNEVTDANSNNHSDVNPENPPSDHSSNSHPHSDQNHGTLQTTDDYSSSNDQTALEDEPLDIASEESSRPPSPRAAMHLFQRSNNVRMQDCSIAFHYGPATIPGIESEAPESRIRRIQAFLKKIPSNFHSQEYIKAAVDKVEKKLLDGNKLASTPQTESGHSQTPVLIHELQVEIPLVVRPVFEFGYAPLISMTLGILLDAEYDTSYRHIKVA